MRQFLFYSLLAGGLLAGSSAAARPVLASHVLATSQPIDSLRETATSYTRYLAHTLRLQGSQSQEVTTYTEAYLWALKMAGSQAAAVELARREYYQAMQRILSSKQYGTFQWLQERERAADQAAAKHE